MIWIIRNNVICKTTQSNIKKTDKYATQVDVEKLPTHIQKLAKVYVSQDNNRPNGVQETPKGEKTGTGAKKGKQNLQKNN